MDGMIGEKVMTGIQGEKQRELVDRLVAVLERHVKNHRSLLLAMEQKKRAMTEGQVEDFDDCARLERAAMDRIAESEAERIEATEAVGEALGFAPRAMRLLDLITVSGEEHRETLLDLRDEMRDLADDIDRLRSIHRTLLLESLDPLFLCLALLGGDHPQKGNGPSPGGKAPWLKASSRNGKSKPVFAHRYG